MPTPPPADDTPRVGQTYLAPVEILRFDTRNPRFVDFSASDPAEIVRFLYDEADLNELVQSISSSGFQTFEPLIVLREGAHLVVLEGNRRLGAVLLLRDPALQAKLSVTVPQLSPEHAQTLDPLLVSEVGSRAGARAYIGFKHINGPHKWGSLAKAKYAA